MNAMTQDHHEPSSIEAEQQLLGSLLLDNDRVSVVDLILTPADFYEPFHGRLYAAIKAKVERGELATPVTMKAAMAEDPALPELGAGYLARLSGASISGGYIKDYAKLVQETSARRSALETLKGAASALRAGEKPVGDILGEVEAALAGMAPSATGKAPTSFLAALKGAVEQINDVHQGNELPSVSIPWGPLRDIVPSIRAGDMVVLGGRPSMGKAQPLHSRIKTRDGWVTMGEVRVGQELASVDGEKSVVTGVFPQGERDVYRITFFDGRSVECSDEHLWHIESSKFSGVRVVETKDLEKMLCKERYQGRIHVPLVSGDFGAGSVPIDPWLLGVLIGDGALTKGVVFSTPDAEILFRVQSTIETGRVVSRGGYDYAITTKAGAPNPIWEGLKSLGLAGKHSCERFIPKVYLLADRETREQLLQGLMDTDGWVERTGAVCYATSSPGLARDIQELVWSLGGVCSISLRETTHLPSYRLYIRHDNAQDFVTLKKKRDRVKRHKPVRMTIKSVEKIGRDECCCISVSHSSRLYVTDYYVVTHNTAVALSIATEAARQGHPVVIASFEMTPEDMAMRALSEATSLSGSSVGYTDMTRQISEDQFREIVLRARELQALPIQMLSVDFARPGSLVSGVRRALRSMDLRNGKTPLVVVDYLQLMDAEGRSKIEKITEISMQAKRLAVKEGAAMLALSQLSRAVETRENKRPILSDLRESGQIEQDADTVIFCYRDEYYAEREKPKEADEASQAEWAKRMADAHNRIELIVAKQRRGPIGTAGLNCALKYNRIWE